MIEGNALGERREQCSDRVGIEMPAGPIVLEKGVELTVG